MSDCRLKAAWIGASRGVSALIQVAYMPPGVIIGIKSSRALFSGAKALAIIAGNRSLFAAMNLGESHRALIMLKLRSFRKA